MKIFLLSLSISLLSNFAVAEDNGILRKASPHSVETTRQRFEEAVQEKGMKVFPPFDHAAAAREYDKIMKPTVVISFGNPAYGTPIMAKNPESGIDFPPKAIIYEDQKGQVWLPTTVRHTCMKRFSKDMESITKILKLSPMKRS
jgi:uncharacterized protein (DUF302 family)